VKARLLQPDGSYRRARPAKGQPLRRSQVEFIALGAVEENAPHRAGSSKTRFPQVKLAASPFASKGASR